MIKNDNTHSHNQSNKEFNMLTFLPDIYILKYINTINIIFNEQNLVHHVITKDHDSHLFIVLLVLFFNMVLVFYQHSFFNYIRL